MLRNIALDVFSLLNPLMRYNKMNHIQFIYLHSVYQDQKQTLRSLIKDLAKSYQFISYSEAVDRIQKNNIDGNYACFSLDDGFKNNLNAVEVFNEYRISACFFICPAYVGLTDESKIEQICRDVFNSKPLAFLNWDDLEKMKEMGHEIGGHTLSHINIALSSADKVKEEVDACFQLLSDRFGNKIHFAYPYGRFQDCTKKYFELIQTMGFVSVASAERGCHVENEQKGQFLIRREHVLLNWKNSHIEFFLKRNKYLKRLQSGSINSLVH